MNQSTDNTEGSLTEQQQQILIGVLLGDGAMRKKTHALLEINHSYTQKEYVDWLYQQFKNYVETPPKVRKGNGNRMAYRFTTKSVAVFTHFYDFFFKGNKKTIPESLTLSPLTFNRDKQYHRIRIKKESVNMFMNMISPYVIPSMKYKLLL